MDSPIEITRMYGELTSRKSKRSFEVVKFAIEDYVTMRGSSNMKSTNIIELIEESYSEMSEQSQFLAVKWNKDRGEELIKQIRQVSVSLEKQESYSRFVELRRFIWTMDREQNDENMFIGYTELVCAAYEFLSRWNELMLNDVLSQYDSNVEHKDKELNFGADWKRNPLGCLKEVIKFYGVVKFKVESHVRQLSRVYPGGLNNL